MVNEWLSNIWLIWGYIQYISNINWAYDGSKVDIWGIVPNWNWIYDIFGDIRLLDNCYHHCY